MLYFFLRWHPNVQRITGSYQVWINVLYIKKGPCDQISHSELYITSFVGKTSRRTLLDNEKELQ